MTNTLKMPPNALNGFMGYGGTRFPHVCQRHFALMRGLSRAVKVDSLLKVIARPADGFRVLGLGLTWRFGCACLITCTLLIPRDKNDLLAIPLYPLLVLALRVLL